MAILSLPFPHRQRRRWAASALTAGCALLTAAGASANTFDVFGFGAEGVADASARVARAEDGTATYYNPGGLALGRRYSVSGGPMLHLSLLETQGEDRPFDEPLGATFAFDADIPLEGPLADRLRFGFGAFFLSDKVLSFRTREQTDPAFPYYDNRIERIVVLPALGIRITDWLGVGVAANALAGVSGPTEVYDGASGGLETRVDQEATTQASAITGVGVRPSEAWRFGFTYRQQFSSENRIRATSNVGGVPLIVDGEIRQSFFSPHSFVLGAAFAPSERIELELDVGYFRWSEWNGPLVSIDAELPGVILRSREIPDLWRDTWTVRGAAGYRLGLGGRDDVTLRVGGGFEPSIHRDIQQGQTNLIDGDKVIASAGSTFAFRGESDGAVRIGIGIQTHLLSSYSQDKKVCTTPGACGLDTVFGDDGDNPGDNVENPGFPTLEGSGSVWGMAITVGVDL